MESAKPFKKRYADKLVEMCLAYGLEVYLMNFEVKIEKADVLLD